MAVLTEEQALLKEQARAWAKEEAPVSRFREMRDSGAELGFDRDTWSSIAKLGWPGIVIPEQYGGASMGHLTFGLVLEELGRQLTASPLLATGLVGATALIEGGSDEQLRRWLPGVADGTAILTLAVDGGPRHAPLDPGVTAERSTDGYCLRGRKTHVLEGLAADALVVSTRTTGVAGDTEGVSLLLVDAEVPGLTRKRRATADSRGYADLIFEGVQVPESALLGAPDAAAPLLEAILDRARAGVAAEMLGVAAQSFDMTLEYLKTRVQFGQVIGGFQALGHRAAALFSAMELTRSCVEAAFQAIDAGTDDVPALCSLAKAQACDFVHHMSNELIQMHGGIGMTDEFDAGLYLKRARALEATFGNAAFHRDRYATLHGF